MFFLMFGIWQVCLLRMGFLNLQVSLKYQGATDPVDCFTVDGVRLPTGYFIGISAATGDLSGNITLFQLLGLKI